MHRKINVAIATNDSRAEYLVNAIEKIASVKSLIYFDPVPIYYKYAAALFSFSRNRRDWWNNYQWHTVTQLARKRNLYRALSKAKSEIDVLLMWGSWFNPRIKEPGGGLPFYVYQDQSCAATKEEGEPGRNTKARIKFNLSQNDTLNHAHGVFCFSNWANLQTLKAHKLASNKVHTVGWGPCSINMVGESINLPKEEPIVLFVGNEFYRKGVDILRCAIPKVIEMVANAKFLIIGSNSDKLSVEPHHALKITGVVNNEDTMKEYFRAASIFVLPHRYDRSPHVIVEAMSAGKPIIASNQGGVTDAVVDGVSGILIPVNDSESLALAIIRLLNNPDLMLKLGTAGRKIMAERFSWEKVAERMVQIIESDLYYILMKDNFP